MRRLSALLVLVLLTGCQSAPPRVQPDTKTARNVAPAEPGLNPHVTLPPGRVQVAPNLPTVTPPPGMISQEQAIAAALKWESTSPARLTLSSATFDERNRMWEVDFAVDDANLAVRPRSHPADGRSNDPVEQRKQRHSWWCLAAALHTFPDGRTGESAGGGHACGTPDRTRTDLEHYRGVIVDGGETTILRLMNPDGSREGRDLSIDIPQSALDADHLALWQVEYGVNRTLEVWGLTGPQERVVAYRLALSDPPPESLLRSRLSAGVPVYPDAIDRPNGSNGSVFLARGADPAKVRTWYEEQLPAYGWQRQAASEGPGQATQFRGAAGLVVQLSLTPVPDGVEIARTWIAGRPL